MKPDSSSFPLAALALALALFASCKLFLPVTAVSDTKNDMGAETTGSVVLRLDAISASRTVYPDINSDGTGDPQWYAPSIVAISGLSSDGINYSSQFTYSSTITVPDLVRGTWALTVTVRNSYGHDLGSGSVTDVLVSSGQTKDVSVVVDCSSGSVTGGPSSVVMDFSWPSSAADTFSYELSPVSSSGVGSPSLSRSYSGTDYTSLDGKLKTGHSLPVSGKYLFTWKLQLSGNLVTGGTEVIYAIPYSVWTSSGYIYPASRISKNITTTSLGLAPWGVWCSLDSGVFLDEGGVGTPIWFGSDGDPGVTIYYTINGADPTYNPTTKTGTGIKLTGIGSFTMTKTTPNYVLRAIAVNEFGASIVWTYSFTYDTDVFISQSFGNDTNEKRGTLAVPFKTIGNAQKHASALAKARKRVSSVKIEKGDYIEDSISFGDGLAVKGSWHDSFSARDFVTSPTKIIGTLNQIYFPSGSIETGTLGSSFDAIAFKCPDTATADLTAFTITDKRVQAASYAFKGCTFSGSESSSALTTSVTGLSIQSNAGISLDSCIIRGMSGTLGAQYSYGIVVQGASPLSITDCDISAGFATFYAYGIYCYYGTISAVSTTAGAHSIKGSDFSTNTPSTSCGILTQSGRLSLDGYEVDAGTVTASTGSAIALSASYAQSTSIHGCTISSVQANAPSIATGIRYAPSASTGATVDLLVESSSVTAGSATTDSTAIEIAGNVYGTIMIRDNSMIQAETPGTSGISSAVRYRPMNNYDGSRLLISGNTDIRTVSTDAGSFKTYPVFIQALSNTEISILGNRISSALSSQNVASGICINDISNTGGLANAAKLVTISKNTIVMNGPETLSGTPASTTGITFSNIYTLWSPILIEKNKIWGGSGATQKSGGISLEFPASTEIQSDIVIRNNLVHAGIADSVSATASAFRLEGSSFSGSGKIRTLSNDFIYGTGSGLNSFHGISLTGTTTDTSFPLVLANNIFATTSPMNPDYFLVATNCHPSLPWSFFGYNAFLGGRWAAEVALFNGTETSLDDLPNTVSSTNISDQTSASPYFQESVPGNYATWNSWQAVQNGGTSITDKGLNLSPASLSPLTTEAAGIWTFSDDYNGDTRANPWSIGAQE